jgi:hypothetical protein
MKEAGASAAEEPGAEPAPEAGPNRLVVAGAALHRAVSNGTPHGSQGARRRLRDAEQMVPAARTTRAAPSA